MIEENYQEKERIGIWDWIAANWKQYKGEVREQWGRLTESDLDYIGGGREKLIGKLRERYKLTEPEATHMVNRWANDIEQT